MKRILVFIVLAIALLSVGAVSGQDSALKVLATTTLVADVARNVGGDLVEVESLVPANADVHAFEPAPQDVLKIAEADVVLAVGAGLEGFLGSLIKNAATVQPVIVSQGVEMLAFGEHGGEADGEHGEAEIVGILGKEGVCDDEHHDEAEHERDGCDPHVWTDPDNVMVWAGNIAEAFAAADATHAEAYRANAAAYIETLRALDAEVTEILSSISEDRRILVTNHEFLGYFAHHYGFEVVGVVIGGGTTLAESDPQQLTVLVEVIKAEQVPAIFAEVSANTDLAQTIAEEARITVVTGLYSDSLSGVDGPASTYADYLRYNARVIAETLGTGGG